MAERYLHRTYRSRMTRGRLHAFEVAIGESVEWLTAISTRVLVGRVLSVKPIDPAATGKNADLQLLTVAVTDTLRGASPGARACVAVRQGGLRDAPVLRQQGTELVLFLQESIQTTSFEGRVCNLWPVRGGDALPAIVPLAAPGKRLLGAARFEVLGTRAAAIAAIRAAAKGLPAPRAGLAKEPPRHFLEVPPGTPVYQALYGGSAVYLMVPRELFPKARPRLGR